jgi:hypothetical protein
MLLPAYFCAVLRKDLPICVVLGGFSGLVAVARDELRNRMRAQNPCGQLQLNRPA